MTEYQSIVPVLKVSLETMDYGQLESGIRDRDGYILAFAEPVDEK
jgi:hypothetical protein